MSKIEQAEYRAKLCLSFVKAPPIFEAKPQRTLFSNRGFCGFVATAGVALELCSLATEGTQEPAAAWESYLIMTFFPPWI